MAEHYLFGTAPYPTNPARVILVKILNAIGGGSGGGNTVGALTQGAGAPVNPPNNTAVTSAYWDTNTDTLYYWNVGNQAWQ